MGNLFQPYFKNCNPPLTEIEIAKVEQELGIKLPYQLRSFYLFANGADLVKTQINLEYPLNCDVMDIRSLDGGSIIAEFKSIEENYDFFGEKIEYGECLFPFGFTTCPWKIYISHTGENLGKIYISEEADDERNFIPVRLIANSFLEFLDMLE